MDAKKKGEKSADKKVKEVASKATTSWIAGEKPKGEDPKIQVLGSEHQRFIGLAALLRSAKTETEREVITTVYDRALKEYKIIALDEDIIDDDDKPEKKPAKKSEKEDKKAAKKTEKEEKEAAKKTEKEEKEAAKKEKEDNKKAEKKSAEVRAFQESFLLRFDPVFKTMLTEDEFTALTAGYAKLRAPHHDFDDFIEAFHEIFPELNGYLKLKKEKKATAACEDLQRWHSWCWNEKAKKPTTLEEVKVKCLKHNFERQFS